MGAREPSATAVARVWRGAVASSEADAYVEYLRETGLRQYAATPGNLDAMILRRDLGALTEIVTFSLWSSREAVRGFAGDDVSRAVFYPDDERFLIERDDHVTHFDVALRASDLA
jgi:heme-degrading monooxygenase HmoA